MEGLGSSEGQSLYSHICSFKIVLPEGKIYARKSALDEWKTPQEFTGVEEDCEMSREGGID